MPNEASVRDAAAAAAAAAPAGGATEDSPQSSCLELCHSLWGCSAQVRNPLLRAYLVYRQRLFFLLLLPEDFFKMPKHFAVELYFDPALENQVLKIWNVLARRQISTQLIEIEARPHITVFASSSIEPSKLRNAIKTFAAKQQPLAVTLAAIGSFATENVLFLAPTPTISLLTFQEQLYELLRREGVEVGDFYRPGSWVPQCTVAEEVPKSRIADAFCILRDFKLPLTGYVFDIGIVEFPPVREHFSFPMGDRLD